MSHSHSPEYSVLVQVSESLSQDDLEKLIRETHKIDFIFYEDLEVAENDSLRHTAILVTPRQAEVITEQEKGNDYAWLYHQYPLADGSVFKRELPSEKGNQIKHCLVENPFRGTGATEAEALASAYQEWLLFVNKQCPTDTPVNLSEVIVASQEEISTEPKIGVSDFRRVQEFGRTSLQNVIETKPKFH
jgi:hypothetical protein